MNTKLSLGILVSLLVVAGVLTYRNREIIVKNAPVVSILESGNGKVEALAVGQKFTLTLPNPGDGGYQFDNPEYDTSLVHLDNHTHLAPQANAPLGNFGTDIWEFTSLAKGSTDLTISASRSWNGEKGNTFKTSIFIR
ncbi:MAG: protease inhibitor I42 family protein [bacterium]